MQGEGELEALSEQFADGEQRIRASLWEVAHGGDRRHHLTEALHVLTDLRKMAAGHPDKSLAQKLDRGAQAASVGAREAFGRESTEPTPEVLLRISDPEHPAVSDENHQRLGDLVSGKGREPIHPSLDHLRADFPPAL